MSTRTSRAGGFLAGDTHIRVMPAGPLFVIVGRLIATKERPMIVTNPFSATRDA
jgi:hypothetical protein